MTIPPDMQSKLNDFDSCCDTNIAGFAKKLDAETPPAQLFHYTNDAGLKGILESGKMWLTSVFNLNDPTELKHSFSHAIKILGSRQDQSNLAR